MTSRAHILAAVVQGRGAGACTKADSPPSPTSTTTTTTTTTTRDADFAAIDVEYGRARFASRAFTVASAGTIQITLTKRRPVGHGRRERRYSTPDGAACNLSNSVETAGASTPQITTAADPGSCCVKVFDIGQIEQSATFSVTIAHP